MTNGLERRIVFAKPGLELMRKVIDSNYLQSEALRGYLAKSRNNLAVLTDYAAMEAFKGDTLISIYRSMEILAEFPQQVIVLKSTTAVCGLRGRRKRLQSRMVDEDQTRGFAEWCRHLERAKQGDAKLQRQLLENGREASLHMDRILADMADYAATLEEIAKTYSPDDLRILRKREPLSPELSDKISTQVLNLAAILFARHPKVVKLPPAKELPNTFIFRFALCGYVLALRWIAVGGAKGVKAERLRNDIVDVNFAAFATYFDGLLTADAKADEIYKEADYLIKNVFIPPSE